MVGGHRDVRGHVVMFWYPEGEVGSTFLGIYDRIGRIGEIG